MATSLARQLAALQTDSRVGRRGKASLLFTAAEADGHDLATLHGIGAAGLAELAEGDARLARFAGTLFSDGWRTRDRETCDPALLPALNAELAACLRALSPHFLTASAAKALEYLLRRYKVHVYNLDALLAATLPYSEAVLFGRLVQTLEIGGPSAASGSLGPGSASAQLWGFLAGCKASGTPAPRSLLVGQAARDVAVLRFLGDAAAAVAGAHERGEVDGSAWLSWYALVCADVASSGGRGGGRPLPDPTLALLAQLALRGIKAGARCAPHATAGQLLAGALSTRTPLARAPFDALLSAVFKQLHRRAGDSAPAGGDADGGEPLDEDDAEPASSARASALASSLACAAALVASQAAHQGVPPASVGASVTQLAAGDAPPGGSSSGGNLTWLESYRLSTAALKRVVRSSSKRSAALAAALGGLCGRFDGVGLAALLTHSLVAEAVQGVDAASASGDDASGTHGAPAAALAVARKVVAALPPAAGEAVTPGLIRAVVAAHSQLAGDDESGDPAATVAQLASLLRHVTQAHPVASESALKGMLAAPASGVSGDASVLAASSSPSLSAATAAWVFSVLSGSQHAPAGAAASASGGKSGLPAAGSVSLSVALASASGAVRLRAMDGVLDMLARLLDGSDRAESGVEPEAAAAGAANARFIHRALAQSLDDEREAGVVLRSLEAHAAMLAAGVALAPGITGSGSSGHPTNDDEAGGGGEDSAAPPALFTRLTLEPLESLFGALQRVLARWDADAAVHTVDDAAAAATAHSVVAACLALLSGRYSASIATAAAATAGPPADSARRVAALRAGIALTVLQRLPVGSEPCAPAPAESTEMLPGSAGCAGAVSAAVSLAASQPLFAALSKVSRHPTSRTLARPV